METTWGRLLVGLLHYYVPRAWNRVNGQQLTNEWNSVEETDAKNDRYSGKGDRLNRGWGTSWRRRRSSPWSSEDRKWESGIWVSVSARRLSRPALGRGFPARGSDLKEATAPGGPRPVPPALLARAGMVSPGQPAQRAPPFKARGRPEALAVTRRGPALPPPPPGKSPLTPLPPSSPPFCGASKTTEFGARG